MKFLRTFLIILLHFSLLLTSCNPRPAPEYESGEYPEVVGIHFYDAPYQIQLGEETDPFQFEKLCGLTIEQGKGFRIADLDVKVSVEKPDVLELISFDRDAILDQEEYGGITVKGLKAETSKVYVTFIYTPTGGTKTIEATVTVTDPAETAE